MQAVIFGLLIPIIPLLLWRSYHKGQELTTGEAVLRYGAYTPLVTLLSSGATVFFCDAGPSFWETFDQLPSCVL